MHTANLAQRLSHHRQELEKIALTDLFDRNPDRAKQMTVNAAHLTLDFSKQRCNTETLQLFEQLGQAINLPNRIDAMFKGAIVNPTEQRAALHASLRSLDATAPMRDEIASVLNRMQTLTEALQQKKLVGFSGQVFTDVVHIGIGGSDLGPRFVVSALKAFWTGSQRVHFVANVDPCELADTLAELNPETTLIITASKTFTTLETLSNSQAARAWLQAAAGDRSIDAHLVAITANPARAASLGTPESQIFPMWDWVGGRYSLWSAIGLPIAIAVGWENFRALLDGAANMDNHYRTAPLAANMPALLAFFECWYSTDWNAHSALVLPYSHRLRLFPAFLQQLSMESLGKSVTIDGAPVEGNTGLVVWGEPGTNSQHSFMQLLHQGTRFIPVDFIAVAKPEDPGNEQHTHLYANCLSQSRALMIGKSRQQVMSELQAGGLTNEEALALAPHKVHSGNRPSNTLFIDRLTPNALGALIALYEHKVHAQSVIWDINAFDQWGVELGKQSATAIFGVISGKTTAALDGSTSQLIERFRDINH